MVVARVGLLHKIALSMGCVGSSPISDPQNGSSKALGTSVSVAVPHRGDMGNKVFPDSPSKCIVVSVVPVSPAMAASHSSASPPDVSKDLKRMRTWELADHAPMAVAGSALPLPVSTSQANELLVENIDSPLADPVQKVLAEHGSGQGLALVMPTSPRKGFSIGEVVSAKAVASKKRRGTVESTEIRESIDTQGRKIVNQ